MIFVYGGVAVDPTRVAEVTAEAAKFVELSNAEDGCIDYILAWDVVEPNRIRLVEAWTTAETSEAHTKQQHTLDWTALIGSAASEAPVFTKIDTEVPV